MHPQNARSLFVFFALVAVLAVSGCGGATSSDGAGAASDCLTPEQVDDQVNQIAAGIETSQAEVEQKQEAIRQVRARACQ